MQSFNFFTDFEKDINVKIGICPVVGKLSPKVSSHKSGWAYMICNQLWHAGYKNSEVITNTEVQWSDYDVILLEHGMEFKGTFNIFGGSNDDLYHQIDRIFTKGIRIYSLHVDMPCIGQLTETRLKTGSDLFKTLEHKIDTIKEICKSIKRVDHIEMTKRLCFGDSHSFSQYSPGFMCSRHDGLTLHGATSRGFEEYVWPWIDEVRIYLGNIDVRHHLMRQKDPNAAVERLVKSYEEELKKLEVRRISPIEVVAVLPIENESRKIPKTGYYKGEPYAGTWKERNAISKKLNVLIKEMCERNRYTFYEHPSIFFNDVEELSFDVMEKPKSVHIARQFYRWDLINDSQNLELKVEKPKQTALF